MDTGFNPGSGTNQQVNSVAVQPDGKIIVVGQFTTFNGTLCNRIVRLNSDGSIDPGFDVGTGANDVIYTLALQPDGKIIVLGAFTTFNGGVYHYIVRLNIDGSTDNSFNIPGIFGGIDVYSLILQPDGKIIIVGDFCCLPVRIVRLNADGSLDTGFDPGSGANEIIQEVILQTDGKIIICGWFTAYNGTARNGIARLNSDGSLDSGFDPGPGIGTNSYIRSILQQPDGKIIIGGIFDSYNGIPRHRIARILNELVTNADESSLLPLTFFPNPTTTEILITGYNPAYLRLCNSLGQTVAEASRSNKLYVGNLPQGLYLLQVFDEKGGVVKTEKVVKAD